MLQRSFRSATPAARIWNTCNSVPVHSVVQRLFGQARAGQIRYLRLSFSSLVLARRGLNSATSSVSPSTGSAKSVVVAIDCSL